MLKCRVDRRINHIVERLATLDADISEVKNSLSFLHGTTDELTKTQKLQAS